MNSISFILLALLLVSAVYNIKLYAETRHKDGEIERLRDVLMVEIDSYGVEQKKEELKWTDREDRDV